MPMGRRLCAALAFTLLVASSGDDPVSELECKDDSCSDLASLLKLSAMYRTALRQTRPLPTKWPVQHNNWAQELDRCPEWNRFAVNALANKALDIYKQDHTNVALLLQLLNLKTWSSEVMPPEAMDDFTMMFYVSMRSALQVGERAESAKDVQVPLLSGTVSSVEVGLVKVPAYDLDRYAQDYPDSNESQGPAPLPKPILDSASVCNLDMLSSFAERDEMWHKERNRWTTIFGKVAWWRNFRSKKDWVMSMWTGYTLFSDDSPMWPPEVVNWSQLFWKADAWEDGLEQGLILGDIGAHRVKKCSRSFGGQTLPLVVALNDPFASLEVRPGFGRYGGDMYFTEDGMPALVITPDGGEVARGDRDWQYWKFVWRSTLFSVITLADHLHMAHYRVANVFASTTREALSPNHPFRRFSSIFTHGAIKVNYQSLFSLQGPKSALARALPFKDFPAVNRYVAENLPSPLTVVAPFRNASEWDALPKAVQEAPYFSDGKMLFAALHSLSSSYVGIYRDKWCDLSDRVVDPELQIALKTLFEFLTKSTYHLSVQSSDEITCDVFVHRLTAYLWMSTAWHRHVGQVGDLCNDPDLLNFSWQDGEKWGPPRQHFIMSVIASATSMARPKLLSKYDHVLKGMEREGQVVKLWASFQASLQGISEEIERRNQGRLVKNYRSDPKFVETSVAV